MSTDMTGSTNPEREPQPRTLTTADMAAAARSPSSPRPRDSERERDTVRDPADPGDSAPIRDPKEIPDQGNVKSAGSAARHDEQLAPLFTSDAAADYRSRWDIAFSRERAALESQMDQPDKAPTETLRITLRRYRSFFERLLSI